MTRMRSARALLLLGASTLPAVAAQSCPGATPDYPAPVLAEGFEATLVATGLSSPRSLMFDSNGNLLVVQPQVGITSHVVKDNDQGCVELSDAKEVIGDRTLNHGLELSTDGKTLYASSAESVWKWAYDPETRAVSGDRAELINGMTRRGHSTRTLMMSRKVENRLLVSWGSQSNIDLDALDVTTGVSQIKAFDVADITTPLNYPSEGLLVGWGLRNSVGVAEHPETGGIYSVENSADQVQRDGADVHQNNPGEEMNFHGTLDITEDNPDARNHGYPTCLAAWGLDEIPNNENLKVGSQFAHGQQNETSNDAMCAEKMIPPAITFAAHQAPLDIKFNNTGTEAWVSFHGSWNRDEPIGYRLAVLKFAEGKPVEPSDSTVAAIDIMTNADVTQCPDNCFRPAGLAIDRQGRIFMTSDETGEIWVIRRTSPEAEIPSSTSTDSSPSPTETGGATGNFAIPYILMMSSISLSLIFA